MSPVPETLEDSQENIGRISGIPVRNLWLLMLYASNLFREIGNGKIDVEENPDDIPDLVAEILCSKVEHRIRRNLSYGYQSRKAVLGRVRGRIDLLQTERHRLLDRGKIACRFDELTVDTPRNRLVRDALQVISRIVRNRVLAHRCRSLSASLRGMGVKGDRPNPREPSINRFGRHDTIDQPMVDAAQLAFHLALPTEAAGNKHLFFPDKDISWVRKLFEKGVAGFYNVVLSGNEWSVSAGKTLGWRIEKKSSGIDRILPSMQTDIVLDNRIIGRRIVIDTKFNSIVTRGWYREETLRSGYIYQIYAYLRSQEDNGDPLSVNAAGLLLHPSVGEMVDEGAVIQDHEIRFSTVDLGATANDIRAQLVRVVSVQSYFAPEILPSSD